jgi:hypothetical protein
MNGYIDSVIKQYELYKSLGEKTLEQVVDDKLNWQYNEESNSISIVVRHLWGNLLSRWTDFLTTDGEKASRDRDAEFETDFTSRKELLGKWNEAWECLFKALKSLREEDLDKTIYIRSKAHSVMDAINRNLAHTAYHVGQIVYIG